MHIVGADDDDRKWNLHHFVTLIIATANRRIMAKVAMKVDIKCLKREQESDQPSEAPQNASRTQFIELKYKKAEQYNQESIN